jgi:hypothetical protein
MLRLLARTIANERGDGLIDGLLALGLVLVAVGLVAQAIVLVEARDLAQAAAEAGAASAATGGLEQGLLRASAVLAAGGADTALAVTGSASDGEATVTVQGEPPALFPLGSLLPSISVSASLPFAAASGGSGNGP